MKDSTSSRMCPHKVWKDSTSAPLALMRGSISKLHVVKLHLEFVWLKTTGVAEEGKSTGQPSDHQAGKEGGQGQPLPAALYQESLPTAPGMTLWQLCSHSCYWILSQPEELTNSAYQAKSLHWVRHLSSFQCSCSFNWPEAVNGGKQQLVYTCLQCPEADDYR